MIPITLGWTGFLFWHGDEDAFVLLFVSTFGSREVKKSKEISCKIITKRAHHLLKLKRETNCVRGPEGCSKSMWVAVGWKEYGIYLGRKIYLVIELVKYIPSGFWWIL